MDWQDARDVVVRHGSLPFAGWPELDYAAYKADGGSATEGEFDALLPAATQAVRAAIWPNLPTTERKAEAYRSALAAAIDVDRQWGGSHGTRTSGGVTVGRYSESQGTGTGAGGYDSELSRAIGAALAGSGLLCKVVVL